VLKAFHRLRKA